MKKILFLSIITCTALFGRAQVILSSQLPPLGLTVKSQLWNFSLINTGNETLTVQVEVVVTDISSGLMVLSGTSRSFLLSKGAMQIRMADAMPINYSPGSPGYPVDPNPDGFLPIGLFNICYSVIKINIDAPEILSEDCQALEVEPLSPPQLMIPLDNEDIGLMRPIFAWLPPLPFNSFTGLVYDWILVEVQPTQSPADAVQQNIPVLTRQNIGFTNFQYPLSMPELDTSKTYAWRITAKNNTSSVATSETWSFRVKQFEADTVVGIIDGFFAKLHHAEDAAYIICNGVLRFEYMNAVNAKSVKLKIFDISSNNRKPVMPEAADQVIGFGQNFIQVDLRENEDMVDGHMYLLEVHDPVNGKGYLKFEYREPES